MDLDLHIIAALRLKLRDYMINKRKKSVITVLMTAMSITSHAGTMGAVKSDNKNFTFYLAPIYGSLSDAGMNTLPYSTTINNNVRNTNFIGLDNRWGYSLGLGYRLGTNKDHDVVLSYTNLQNFGLNQVPVPTGSTINTDPTNGLNLHILNGPASARVSSYFNFQTTDLITHHYFQSESLDNVQFSRYYGVKATQWKKGFIATYKGNDINQIQQSNDVTFAANYFGIGPRIGMGSSWDLLRYLSLMGDVSASLLAGSYHTKFDELQYGVGSYSGDYPTVAWGALVVGANLAVGTHVDFSGGSILGVQVGINTEQYWSRSAKNDLSAQNYISNDIVLRDVFLKFSYNV